MRAEPRTSRAVEGDFRPTRPPYRPCGREDGQNIREENRPLNPRERKRQNNKGLGVVGNEWWNSTHLHECVLVLLLYHFTAALWMWCGHSKQCCKIMLLYLFDQSTNVEAGERGLLSRFQDNSVPAAQRWPQFPCCHHQGEVPLHRHRSGTYCGSSFRQPHISVSWEHNSFTNDFRFLHIHLETECF